MRDDIIERCALAVRKAKAGLQTDEAIARAVLAAFKEATAEPTPGMVDVGIETHCLFQGGDPPKDVVLSTHEAMQARLWQETGI